MHRQAGLTLVELMVASTLSIVLLAGVIVLFSANKVTYRLQEGLSAIQDSGRYAVSRIKRDIEVAGFGGCITEDLATSNPKVIAKNPSPFIEDYQIGIRVSGQDDVNSVTIDGTNVVDGTDTLQIRGPLTGELFYTTGPTFTNNPVVVRGDGSALGSGDFVQITDCAGAEIFEISGAVSVTTGSNPTSSIPHGASANNPSQLSRRFGADSILTPLVTRIYFIGTSAGTNRAGGAVSALFVSDGATSQEVLQGVEDMQITYATDENDDGNVDYAPADSVTDWAAVLGVRISLLANSIEPSAQEPASYVYLPNGSMAISPPDRLLRQEFAIVATLRNNVK
jgi:type IV pilus assembly protein PilW